MEMFFLFQNPLDEPYLPRWSSSLQKLYSDEVYNHLNESANKELELIDHYIDTETKSSKSDLKSSEMPLARTECPSSGLPLSLEKEETTEIVKVIHRTHR